MVECDHHPTYRDVSASSSLVSIQEKIIQDELIWGLSYRHLNKKEKEVPIPPKKSPMDIPFKICREKQRKRKRKRKVSKAEKPSGQKQKAKKLSLLERSLLSQNQYMQYLAIPNVKITQKDDAKKNKCRCDIEPCPPRFVQLAVPQKRRVFANWKEYYNFLPTVMITRFEKILHTDKNLEPREARYYYKKLDQQKRKRMRAKRVLRKKERAQKEKGEQAWLDVQIRETVKVIMDYIMEEPLFSLNYRQLLLSDGILERLDEAHILKKPSRGTRNSFKRFVIEFSDKVAVWMDTLTRFVDIQAIDGDEDIAPLTISSLSEEEEESEASTLSELERALWAQFGEEGEGGLGFGLGLTPSQLMGGLFGEGEGEEGLESLLGDIDLDLLEKLIRILSNCSEEFLNGEVNPEKMPGVRYIDILNRIKELRDGILKKGPQKPFLETIMLEWAVKNQPDEVDDKMRNKIHETAALLGDFLFGPGGLRSGTGADAYDRPGYGMYGEEGEGGEIVEEAFLKEAAGTKLEAAPGGELGEGWSEGGEDELTDDERMRIEEEKRRREEAEEAEEGEDEEKAAARKRREEERLAALEAEGADTATDMDVSIGKIDEGEEGPGYETLSGLGVSLGLGEEGFGEEEGEVAVLFGPGLEGRIIKGHKPSVILDHRPDMVCCLSLKTWAVWLLEITHNAHNWTRWVHCVILQVKEFAAIVRGDVKLPNGEPKKLYKAEWRKFAQETAIKIESWKEYSKHVKDLSNNIIENFHGKKVLNCCPKCLQDHLITNVVKAHETLAALTEAMNMAEYWQNCLDEIVQKTCRLTDLEKIEKEAVSSSESEEEESEEEESEESVYEIEELDATVAHGRGRGACTPRQVGPGMPGAFRGRQGPFPGEPAPWQRGFGSRSGPPGAWQGSAGPSGAPGPSRGRGCHPRRF